ncbi:MAG: hypothetical protein M1463_02800, partial [Candidatus Thermoplasmatota archaeon]|nr:hypothetical protein [Candidatus Thermoplasmatota archaeon]
MNLDVGRMKDISSLDTVICMEMEDVEPASTRVLLDTLKLEPAMKRLGGIPRKGKTVVLPSMDGPGTVIVVGLGKREKVDLEALRTSLSTAIKALSPGSKNIGIVLPEVFPAETEAMEVAYTYEITVYSF